MLNINNTLESYLQNVEIKGNTIQNPNNLSDIKSVGDKIDDQEVYRIPIVCTNGLDKSSSDYKEHKITILSPVQLEKVGDVADRIVEKDGVWGVEKNIVEGILDSNVAWSGILNIDGYTSGWRANNYSLVMCNKLKQLTSNEWESKIVKGLYSSTTSSNIGIAIPSSELSSENSSGLNEWVKNNKPIVKFVTTKPQFIPLPNSQQVKLKTFANKTNISFLTEIEGTIKADVAKSINASVKSNTQEIGKINNRILDLEGLKESQEMSYETDKGYLVCKETKPGTVKDLKLSGKSLINKASSVSNYSNNLVRSSALEIAPNIEFTIIAPWVDKYQDVSYCIAKMDGAGNIFTTYIRNHAKTFTISDSESQYALFVRGSTTDVTSIKEELNKYLILEGDHTQNPPKQYFEGIASVGTGVDKIEVLSYDNGNLFDGLFDKCGINFTTGELTPPVVTNQITTVNHIKVTPNIPVNYKSIGKRDFRGGGNTYIFFYDRNKKYIDKILLNTFNKIIPPTNCYYIRIRFVDFELSDSYPKEDYNIIINQCGNLDNSNFVKQDKKTLLFKDSDGTWKPISELRGLDTVCDTIELHNDGKYYYHIRTEKKSYSPNDESNSNVITDKTNTIAKLAKEKVFEVNPLFLEAFENETMILCESGAVKPGIEWKITSYITNLVSTNTKRIKRIENDFYNYTVSQNRMMLSSRYNADRADFRIDNTLGVPKTVSVELDYDLFELMKKVVIVGKDNYDRSKIEEQMDFYVTEGFIDWDMWDELFAIIELQHNPPVDLIPIEPISIEEPKPKKSRRGRKKKVEEI